MSAKKLSRAFAQGELKKLRRMKAPLVLKLEASGPPRNPVAAALAQLKDSELDRAREVWRKKFGAPPQDAQERSKQIRFLITRGFAAEVVRRVVQGADED